MPLEEYKRKRDFSKTPEPAGRQVVQSGPKRFFCVQKHLASHLHYDFRLEHNGVLLSWAVPKGPSLDPGIKRLAMHVEDHPLDYGEFEGVIPEGYGAGIVMLWDRGTWTPEASDIDGALKRGDLKFTLDGYKLKGSWVLVRTGGRPRGGTTSRGTGAGSSARSWLLIKHRDEWSGDLDIAEFAPRSVKSDGDFEDILAQDTPALWLSHRPAKGGEAGALLGQIIERAAKLRASKAATNDRRSPKPAGPRTKGSASGRRSRSVEPLQSRVAAAPPPRTSVRAKNAAASPAGTTSRWSRPRSKK